MSATMYDIHVPHTLPASVDSPDTKRKLGFPFVPAQGRVTKAVAFKASQLPPLDKLPLVLVPRPKQSMRPPLMHYGWLVDTDALLQYAAERNIVGHEEKVVYSDDEESDTEEDDDEEEERDAPVITMRPTMEAAVGFIADRVGLQFPPQSLLVAIPLRPPGVRVVSVYTNYNLDGASSEENVKAFGKQLAKELNMDEQDPKWYLNGISWHWEY
ncbi:hypothetical protein AcV5_003784 [Taiwanofungus camphoratus]|nr:hypothetical protein AcV5_003784 [Antrodia cinnamomea]KAI0937692.1 hypothetical protein AcV7_003658 [Antrodia cinnamomea]